MNISGTVNLFSFVDVNLSQFSYLVIIHTHTDNIFSADNNHIFFYKTKHCFYSNFRLFDIFANMFVWTPQHYERNCRIINLGWFF